MQRRRFAAAPDFAVKPESKAQRSPFMIEFPHRYVGAQRLLVDVTGSRKLLEALDEDRLQSSERIARNGRIPAFLVRVPLARHGHEIADALEIDRPQRPVQRCLAQLAVVRIERVSQQVQILVGDDPKHPVRCLLIRRAVGLGECLDVYADVVGYPGERVR